MTFRYRLFSSGTPTISVLSRHCVDIRNYFRVDANEVAMVVGSMVFTLSSSGDFCASSMKIVDY
ncbi:hypothetical protein BCR42DRAFT_426001 [Absidia repens]|uniref:Uncharacterized protein n=1 Tax=Absidia repens TaxID=90262 RepID=A0A1X2I3M5_9FUNG|nr:hypothetical protein BCR42DRAFT_426001 [Absidia repens]